MPHFVIPITPNGALLDIVIGVSQARGMALQAAGQSIPNVVQLRALLDTGASFTCIDPTGLSNLNITPKGTTTVNTPSTGINPITVNTYDIGILIPGSAPPPLFLNTVEVAETSLINLGIQALIGRDILERFVFHYNGIMKIVTLSY